MTTDTLDVPVQEDAVFTLTADQESALNAFIQFLLDPIETVFVLKGYSGCGKSTLVKTILERMDSYQKTCRLVNPSMKEYPVVLAATTNKAAENLAAITGMECGTIHSVLGLRVEKNYRTNVTTLVGRPNFDMPEHVLLFIDEASYVGKEMLGHVFTRTKDCKVVFIGDPAQLTDIKATSTPVFDAGFTGAALTEVVRQAKGNPIVDLSTAFRHTVNTGVWTPFTPDGHHIKRVTRAEFNKAIEAEFTRPGWKYEDSKILSWTNKAAIAFNGMVRNLAKGDPEFKEGDYAVCNQHLVCGKQTVKTDAIVLISNIEPATTHRGVRGNWMNLDHSIRCFVPKSLEEWNLAIKTARAAGDHHLLPEMETQWADLRGAYASTINKAQGSTYGTVFIDIDDLSGCNSGNQIARMLYVGVSRAKNHVYLTGDFG